MKIIERALELEKNGEQVLRNLAEETSSLGLRRIFLLLADDEVGHQRILNNLLAGKEDEVNSKGINQASNIFVSMVGDEEELSRIRENLELYSDLQKMENEAEALYSEEAKRTDNPIHREIFYKLAEEEQRHTILIENIIEMATHHTEVA